jgi:uncharacterized coiled-coil protein SlyX
MGKVHPGAVYLVGGVRISYFWKRTLTIPGTGSRRMAMAKSMEKQDSTTMEKRMEELEIKLSFLEKELEEYKEANRNFYRKINELEDEIQKLQREVPESNMPTPEVTWDSEGHNIRP